mgnify:CR=1 FL=1
MDNPLFAHLLTIALAIYPILAGAVFILRYQAQERLHRCEAERDLLFAELKLMQCGVCEVKDCESRQASTQDIDPYDPNGFRL